ncbi:probable GOR1 |uniref:2-hydroxyacid dehydrogenase n=2 Tax=Melanopsichium pennsylvanicum TaxID=63383 RepID=A0A077QRB8_9BASI|nr:2-hydroxyacid dehydrogenase [Melanopsichium pennsylvanicum 4]SNX82454.1 probable GOR1 \
MSKPQVLVCGTIVHAHNELKNDLGSVAEILHLDTPNRDEFFTACKSGKYSNIAAIYRHNDSADKIGVFDSDLIAALPSSLKFICHNGAGYDQIDVHAAKTRGITVSHTPSAVDDATADTAMFLVLSSLRQYYRAEVNARSGKWKSGLKPAHDPEGKVLGIIGMGGIGSALAKRAAAFDMKIIYYNRNPNPNADPSYTYVKSQQELLAQSDVVSLNLPLNKQTEKSFGKTQFDQMKDGAILVNTARGGVVDEDALIDALNSGKLSSAGLDVYPAEPKIDQRLVKMDQCILLPHMGTETVETQKKMEVQVFGSIKTALQTGKPSFIVKEHK